MWEQPPPFAIFSAPKRKPAQPSSSNQMQFLLMKNAPIKPPARLSEESGIWWSKILSEYEINDPAGLLILETSLRARDRMVQASVLIDQHGAVTLDRFEQLRANPAVTMERDARAAMLASLRALNLDYEQLNGSVGRPAGR